MKHCDNINDTVLWTLMESKIVFERCKVIKLKHKCSLFYYQL